MKRIKIVGKNFVGTVLVVCKKVDISKRINELWDIFLSDQYAALELLGRQMNDSDFIPWLIWNHPKEFFAYDKSIEVVTISE